MGAIDIDAEYHSQTALVIIDGDGATLLGQDWLPHFRAKLHKINSRHNSKLETAQHAILFEQGLGKIVETTAKLYLKKEARPKFCWARQVPYVLYVEKSNTKSISKWKKESWSL